MAGYQHQLLAACKPRHVIPSFSQNLILLFGKLSVILKLIYHQMQRVNNRVASHKYLSVRFLIQQVFLTQRGRCKVIRRNPTCYLAVHLLWPRAIDIMCS